MTHTGYITYDANTARLEDLQLLARRPLSSRARLSRVDGRERRRLGLRLRTA
jgi:hypothetical protein